MEPDQILKEASDVFKEKKQEYGMAYLRHGNIMNEFFPDGIKLNSPEDFGAFHIFELEVIKMNRIATSMSRKEFHEDSHVDLMVYPAMAIHLNKFYNNKEDEGDDKE